MPPLEQTSRGGTLEQLHSAVADAEEMHLQFPHNGSRLAQVQARGLFVYQACKIGDIAARLLGMYAADVRGKKPPKSKRGEKSPVEMLRDLRSICYARRKIRQDGVGMTMHRIKVLAEKLPPASELW